MDERTQIIIALISGQDALKWREDALVEWASLIADRILQNGTK